MSWLLLDYVCESGHRFESLQARSAVEPSLQCPHCHSVAERAISAVRCGTVWGAVVSRAKPDERPNPGVLNTESLADGKKYSDWKKERRAFRAEERRRELKKELG